MQHTSLQPSDFHIICTYVFIYQMKTPKVTSSQNVSLFTLQVSTYKGDHFPNFYKYILIVPICHFNMKENIQNVSFFFLFCLASFTLNIMFVRFIQVSVCNSYLFIHIVVWFSILRIFHFKNIKQ